MQSLFFFDDWLLDVREGLDRNLGQPRLLKEIYPQGHPVLNAARLKSVHYNAQRGRYIAYADCLTPEGHRRFLTRLETDDALEWPLPRVTDGPGQLWQRTEDVVLDQDGEALWPSDYTLLAGTPLADRGYVATVIRYKDQRRQFFAFSQDGLHFEILADKPWRPYVSDTGNPVVWDPFKERYLVGCRPDLVDRRVAMATTLDFETVSEPGVILQPDSADLPGTEFYGMDFRRQDDVFVGALLVYLTEPTERQRVKMVGCVEVHLAYSYDGDHWYRPFREPFLARRDPGQAAGGSIYAGLPGIRTSDDRELIFAGGSIGDHGVSDTELAGLGLSERQSWGQLLFDLRPDGYVYLKTQRRWGQIRTRGLLIEGDELTLNTHTLPTGQVRVQALDPEGYEPIPGFTLEECLPVTGDHLAAPVRWQERGGLGGLKGRPVLLEVHVREGELYAMRFDYRPYYAVYRDGREAPERI